MLARIRKAQENEGGFTLIELLVVMIIIGILAAIAIPAFLNQKKKARESAAKSDASNVSKEIAAALVDGALDSLKVTGTAPNYTLTYNIAATGETGVTSTVKTSDQMTLNVYGDVAAAAPGGEKYCVVVTPAASTGASPWHAGPNGLGKGATTANC